jgi:hypothetical protein
MSLSVNKISQASVERVGKHGMGNKIFSKESGWTNSLCSIDDLIRKNKITGRDFFSERANSRESEDSLDTEMLQSCNVGTTGNFRGCKVVTTSMASQKGYFAS